MINEQQKRNIQNGHPLNLKNFQNNLDAYKNL